MLEDRVSISHHQVHVCSGPSAPRYDVAFAGQANGLLGAGDPGALVLVCGTHTGHVGLRVVLHDAEPPLDDAWEDVVEATFVPAGRAVTVAGLMDDVVATVELAPATYRVRWSGTGVDEAYDGVVMAHEPLIDRFELALWPAPPAPDRVLRQGSVRGREAHAAVRAR